MADEMEVTGMASDDAIFGEYNQRIIAIAELLITYLTAAEHDAMLTLLHRPAQEDADTD
jgi:hypothetical protein